MKVKPLLFVAILATACVNKHVSSETLHETSLATQHFVFFDLGNTLVDSTDLNNVRYLDGAKSYLETLRIGGFGIGLLSNVPESWGPTQTAKLAGLIRLVDKGWKDTTTPLFDWSPFDDGALFLPRNTSERKPSPALFLRAAQAAKPCGVLYIGEVRSELEEASRHGFATYQVGTSENFYPPLSVVSTLIRETSNRRQIDEQRCGSLR